MGIGDCEFGFVCIGIRFGSITLDSGLNYLIFNKLAVFIFRQIGEGTSPAAGRGQGQGCGCSLTVFIKGDFDACRADTVLIFVVVPDLCYLDLGSFKLIGEACGNGLILDDSTCISAV